MIDTSKTLQQLAVEYGIPPRIIMARLRNEKSIEESFTTPHTASVTYTAPDGRSVTNLRELARAHGIKYITLRNRLASGWSMEDALKMPRKAQSVDLDKRYGMPITEWLKQSGITKAQFNSRISRGWDPERAARQGKSFEAAVLYRFPDADIETVLSTMAEHGISAQAVRKRMAEGWPLEKCITVPAVLPLAKVHAAVPKE